MGLFFSLENLGSTNKWLYLNLKKMKLERWSLNFFYVGLWSICYRWIMLFMLLCCLTLQKTLILIECGIIAPMFNKLNPANTSWKTFCRFPFRNIVMNIVSPPWQRNDICTSSVILVWQWITTQPWPDKIDCVHTLNPSRPPDLSLSPP